MWIKIKTHSLVKKIIIIILSVILVGAIATAIFMYVQKKEFREWVDEYILNKNLTEQDIETINLNTDKNNQMYVYARHIAVLKDKTLTLYNPYGEEETSINVNMNTAIFDSNDKYFVLAEQGGKEVCLILDKTYLWSETVEGEILQIHVNRNGYVAVITTDVTNKSILTLYNSEGMKIFTRYFATTRIIDASISEDNKYIAIGEFDSSGAIIQSSV